MAEKGSFIERNSPSNNGKSKDIGAVVSEEQRQGLLPRVRSRVDCEVSKIQAVLIDHRTLIRDSISDMLMSRAAELFVLTYSALAEFLSGDPKYSSDVSIVIISIGSAEVSQDSVGVQIQQLKQAMPAASIVIFCDSDDVRSVMEAYRRGISGYIPTTLKPKVIVGALRLIHAGGIFIPHNAIEMALREPAHAVESFNNGSKVRGLEGFTSRQQQVLQLLRQGKANKRIAYELGIEESTVKVYVRQIMRKLHVTNRTHAALLAQQMCGELAAV
jgi:DNA-binding NarL/FixJ family response regulator